MRSGQVSETARRVAAHRLAFTRLGARFGDPEADDRLTADVAGTAAPSDGPMHSYLRARTRFFDRVVVNAVEGGFTQVVIGAAGYDGRALRYARQGVRWFEVDHPATQSDKLLRLDALGIRTDDIEFVPADFDRDPLAPGLIAAGFDPAAKSLFLLEGVAVYLALTTLQSVLVQLSELAAAGSRLAISLSVSGESPITSIRRSAFRRAVAALGEPAVTTIGAEDANALLEGAGWRALPAAGEPAGRARAAGLVVAAPVPHHP